MVQYWHDGDGCHQLCLTRFEACLAGRDSGLVMKAFSNGYLWGPTEEDIAVVLLNVYGIPVKLPPTYLYLCHRSVLLLASIRETSFLQ